MKTKNAILIGAGIAAAGVAVSCAVTDYFVKFAMDRNPPLNFEKMKQKLPGANERKKYRDSSAQAAEQLEHSGCETIEIIGYNNTRLVGHWKPCETPKRIIIAMHGWRVSWSKDFGLISDFLHDNDCCVLYAEQRAQNQSDGNYMTFGMFEHIDCLCWIAWANSVFETEIPIYLYGISMGATSVLMAANADLPDNVHGIIADCGFTSTQAVWKHAANHTPFRFCYSERRASKIYKKKTGTSFYSVKKIMRNNQTPVLFIHGETDDFVPVSMTLENYFSCSAPEMLLIVPDAGHAMSYYTNPQLYQETLLKFWSRYDRKE